MKITLICMFLLCCVSRLYAQSINIDSIFEPKLRGEIYQPKTGIEGNQFYNDNWTAANIKLNTGEIVTNKLLKYSMFEDQLIWLPAGSFRLVKLEKHFIDEFTFINQSGTTTRFKRKRVKLASMSDSTDIFVEVLTEKAAGLFVFRTVRIENATSNLNGELFSVKKLVPQPVYILIFPDRQTISFRSINKRVLLKVTPEKYKAILKTTFEKEHLSVRNENDLCRIASELGN